MKAQSLKNSNENKTALASGCISDGAKREDVPARGGVSRELIHKTGKS